MFLVDTNILLYAANDEAQGHETCRELLAAWRSDASPWHTTWGVIYEFLRVMTHPRVLTRPWPASQAWGFVEALLEAPGFRVLTETDRHGAVARQILEDVTGVRGSRMHDAHTAILMREHGIRTIYTRDADFRLFPFLEVVDPLV